MPFDYPSFAGFNRVRHRLSLSPAELIAIASPARRIIEPDSTRLAVSKNGANVDG